jgi:hypothetical protein
MEGRIFRSEREQVARGWSVLHMELDDMYAYSSQITVSLSLSNKGS